MSHLSKLPWSDFIERISHRRGSGRFSSVDAMHEAVFGCLVAKGAARYSAYISYRAASEAPLARLLFREPRPCNPSRL
jgi:hypothetical protein